MKQKITKILSVIAAAMIACFAFAGCAPAGAAGAVNSKALTG